MNVGDGNDSPWDDAPSAGTKAETSVRDPLPSASAAPKKTPGGRAGRGGRRQATQPVRLEAVDDSLGPLGPLGVESQSSEAQEEDPPALPRKERQIQRNEASVSSPPPSRGRRQPASPNDEPDEPYPRARVAAQPVQPASPDGPQRQPHPSMSIEQASKPSFNISVGDPHKVGDLTGSHTVYQVRTRTTSKAYRVPEFEVSRRYKDFLWLYNQLHSNNPGVIVPPPPEKQAVGRFDINFVESRRAALEKMLNKTAAHPILQHDGDLKLFLESESFNLDTKHRDRKDPDIPESKGMFSSMGLSVGSGTKYIEHDDWFLDRRFYLDTLESQLKALLRATDTAVSQRSSLAHASYDLATSLATLSQVELSSSLSGPLAGLSDLQLRIRDLYDRQAQQDVLTLGIVIDEYIRLIGSIKKAFEQRQRSWQTYHNAESDLAKRRSALDKLMRQGRSQQDKMSQLQADCGDAERRAHQMRLQFDDLGRGMRSELERFEREKVEDFRMGVETYLESAVEAQKELIELWETYLMHLDADEEDTNDTHPPLNTHAQQSSKENTALPDRTAPTGTTTNTSNNEADSSVTDSGSRPGTAQEETEREREAQAADVGSSPGRVGTETP